MFTLKVTSTRKCFRSCAGEERLAAFVSIVKKFFSFQENLFENEYPSCFRDHRPMSNTIEAYRVHINQLCNSMQCKQCTSEKKCFINTEQTANRHNNQPWYIIINLPGSRKGLHSIIHFIHLKRAGLFTPLTKGFSTPHSPPSA